MPENPQNHCKKIVHLMNKIPKTKDGGKSKLNKITCTRRYHQSTFRSTGSGPCRIHHKINSEKWITASPTIFFSENKSTISKNLSAVTRNLCVGGPERERPWRERQISICEMRKAERVTVKWKAEKVFFRNYKYIKK